MSEVIVEETGLEEDIDPRQKQFTRLERMLLFAVVSECDRCICSEGTDCLQSMHKVDCPFFRFRQEYKVYDIEMWQELVK